MRGHPDRWTHDDIADFGQEGEKGVPQQGKIEKHHITPKYLGGDPKGPMVSIDAAYHQKITNEFRKLAPYGQKSKPSKQQVEKIVEKVGEKFPLPDPG